MKKMLCVPCANGLRAEGKQVQVLGCKSVKITCAVCRRRRFGVAYEVTGSVRAVENSADGPERGRGEWPKAVDTSPSRREAARCEQARRDNENAGKKKKG